MNDKSLLSLREIARELNLNYKTILNFKNQLGRFLPGVFDGKNFKYFPASKEILSLIAALRDEGYTFVMIQEIFLRKRHVINDPQINEWVGECIESHGQYWVDSDGSGHADTDQVGLRHASMDQDNPACARMDEDGPVCASMDEDGSVCASMDQSGSIQANPDADGSVQAGTDQSKPRQPDPDQDGLAHSGTDLAVQIRTSLDEAKQFWLKEVEVVIRSLLAEQSESTQKVLQKMATQSNIAITALCESTQDIRNGLLSINDRLSRLERDLDVEAAEPLEIYEVDAGNYQVDLPEISLPDITPPLTVDLEPGSEPGMEPTPEATPDSTPQDLSDDHDLGSVRDSIDNGIPDRDVLVDWAMEKRQQDENTYSYNVLAGILNKSAIPTMSGREKWSRSTVRNLLVRTLKNRE